VVRQTEIVRFDVEPEPVTASDDEIRASLVDAQIPPLLASVAHLTGDLSIIRADLCPDLARVLEPDAGYSPEQIAEARELAAGALIRHRDSGSPKQPPLSAAVRRRLVEFVSGSPIDDEADYTLPVWAGELPLRLVTGTPISDPRLQRHIQAPAYIQNYQVQSRVSTTLS